jgi:hypothetical protein
MESLGRYHHAYTQGFEAAAEVCLQNNKNIVLPRYDGDNVDFDPLRPWTFNRHSYVTFDLHSNAPLPLCRNVDGLLASSLNGSRVYYQNASIFQPYGCAYRWYSPQDICSILSRFSTFYFYGDSIIRHSYHTFIMLITGDYVRGALQRLFSMEQQVNCICDGQLSEALKCREGGEVVNIHSHHYGLCGNKPYFYGHLRNFYGSHPLNTMAPILCLNDSRPRFILLHFGMHFHLNARRTT